MPYCPNCGNPVNAGDRFCANCGTAIQVQATVVPVANNVSTPRSDYRIVLVSRGTCSRAVAIDMLSDLLGYTDADAARIIDNAPMEIALGLTAIQAQYISQAITEYGMQVSIYNNDGYVDMGSKATASVFNSDGSFLNVVASVLTGLTVSNRITKYNRWSKPAPLLFMPAYRRPAPPPVYHRRRTAPRPVVRPTPPPHNIPRPAPMPAPPSSVASSRPGAVRHPAPTPIPHNAPGPVGPINTNNQSRPGGAGRGGQGGPMGPMGPAGGRRG